MGWFLFLLYAWFSDYNLCQNVCWLMIFLAPHRAAVTVGGGCPCATGWFCKHNHTHGATSGRRLATRLHTQPPCAHTSWPAVPLLHPPPMQFYANKKPDAHPKSRRGGTKHEEANGCSSKGYWGKNLMP